jgi:hypothetical protein
MEVDGILVFFVVQVLALMVSGGWVSNRQPTSVKHAAYFTIIGTMGVSETVTPAESRKITR